MLRQSKEKDSQHTSITEKNANDAHAQEKSKYFFGLKGQALHRAVAFLAGGGFVSFIDLHLPSLYCYDQGVMSALLTLPTFYNQFPQTDTTTTTGAQNSHNSVIQGLVVGIYEIGCLFGALWTGLFLSDRYGRRVSIFIGSIWMVVGAIIQASSFSLAQMIVGRVVTGIGNGHITSTVPTYQSECSRPEKRGKLVMIEGALITGGICISYWIDFIFYWAKGSSVNWRGPIALQVVFALFLMSFCLSLPESPRWLVKNGDDEEAAAVFSALEDLPPNHPYITAQIKNIKKTLQTEKHGVSALFHNGKQRHFHRATLGFVNQMFQQISGINIITYYATTIYQNNLGLDATISRVLGACNGTEYFAASWIAVYTIEKFGRRNLMLFGAAGQAGTMAILAGTAYLAQGGNNGAAIAAAVFLFVFNTFFAIGWLGMTWLYPAEIVSTEVRAPANGFSTASNWAFNFMVVMVTPVAFATIQYKTWIVFGVINGCLILPATYIFYPETAGRSLEEMDDIFSQENAGWFNIVRLEKEFPRSEHRGEGEPVDPAKLEATGNFTHAEAKALAEGPQAVDASEAKTEMATKK